MVPIDLKNCTNEEWKKSIPKAVFEFYPPTTVVCVDISLAVVVDTNIGLWLFTNKCCSVRKNTATLFGAKHEQNNLSKTFDEGTGTKKSRAAASMLPQKYHQKLHIKNHLLLMKWKRQQLLIKRLFKKMLHCKSVWHEVSFLANVPESLEENWSKYEWWIKGHLWLFMHMVITMILIFHLLFGKMKTHFRVQMCSFKNQWHLRPEGTTMKNYVYLTYEYASRTYKTIT